MSTTPLREILLLCRSLDATASEIYQTISTQVADDDQRDFWVDVSQDEARHAAYWEQLIALEGEGKLNHVFDRPDEVKMELEALKRIIDGMVEENNDFSDSSMAVLFAFRIEHLMLNPSFAVLFHALESKEGDHLPGVDYWKHVDKFLQFVRNFLDDKKELLLIGEILSKVWKHNLDMANQFVQIKTLRGLIPICASCKKIRDDSGFWSQIESYFEEHTDAQFTHGLCPDCIKKLYPEYWKKERMNK